MIKDCQVGIKGIVCVGDEEGIQHGVKADAVRRMEARAGSAAIGGAGEECLACEGGDDTCGRDFPQSMVGAVSDDEVVHEIDGDGAGLAEARGGAGAIDAANESG